MVIKDIIDMADKEAERLKEIIEEYQGMPINWLVKVKDLVSGTERIFHMRKDREEQLRLIFTLSNRVLEYHIAAGGIQSDHIFTGNKIYEVKAYYKNADDGAIKFTITKLRHYMLEELFEPLVSFGESLNKDATDYMKGKTAQIYSKFMKDRKKLKQEQDTSNKKDSEKENRALEWHTSRLAYEGLKFSDALKLYQNSDFNDEDFLNYIKETVIDGLSTEEDGSVDNDSRKVIKSALKLADEKGDPFYKSEKEKYLKLQKKKRAALVSFFDNQTLHSHAAAIANILNKRSQDKYIGCGIVIKREHTSKNKKSKKRCKS